MMMGESEFFAFWFCISDRVDNIFELIYFIHVNGIIETNSVIVMMRVQYRWTKITILMAQISLKVIPMKRKMIAILMSQIQKMANQRRNEWNRSAVKISRKNSNIPAVSSIIVISIRPYVLFLICFFFLAHPLDMNSLFAAAEDFSEMLEETSKSSKHGTLGEIFNKDKSSEKQLEWERARLKQTGNFKGNPNKKRNRSQGQKRRGESAIKNKIQIGGKRKHKWNASIEVESIYVQNKKIW